MPEASLETGTQAVRLRGELEGGLVHVEAIEGELVHVRRLSKAKTKTKAKTCTNAWVTPIAWAAIPTPWRAGYIFGVYGIETDRESHGRQLHPGSNRRA